MIKRDVWLRVFRSGGRCEVDGQCVGESGSSGCRGGICICAGIRFFCQQSDCLLSENQSGEQCMEIQQCQKGDMGTLSICVGNDPNNKMSIVPDAISQPGNNLCRMSQLSVPWKSCKCKSEAVESSDGTKCLLKSYIDDACDDVNQCSWITGSTCQNKNVSDPATEKICRCSADYVNVEFARDVCYLKAKAIGQSCALHPIQCIDLDDSQCLRDQKICACHNLTQVVSGDKKRCLSRVAGLNTTCIESAQCSTQNSECLTTNVELKEKQCKCLRNQYVEGWEQKGKCLKIADDLRVSCEEQHQCTSGLGPLSECKDGYCLCKASYTYYDGQCYFPATLNGRCNLDGECKAGVNNYTYCNNNTNRCSCVEEAFENNNLCYGRKVVGDFCNTDTECTLNIEGPVSCDGATRRCACSWGYVPELENTICVNSALQLGTNIGIIILALIFSFSQKLY
ncbi:Tenascin-X [Orchesella cincta]|uniref:Tenascin-X n=1 Tax=Orchesella cincta TaxID=48709 RepID=A0A1D2MHX3_ORCCI|nr:Tenascin-X [Orchesella cincta]